MTTHHPPDRCPACRGRSQPRSTTFTADSGTGAVVVRDVPASLCSRCGVEWLDDSVAEKLEKVVRQAIG